MKKKKPLAKAPQAKDELDVTVTGAPESPESLKRGVDVFAWVLECARKRRRGEKKPAA